MKKIIITSLALLATLTLAPMALGAAPSKITAPKTSNSESAIVTAIQNLAAEIQALNTARTKSNNNATYQEDQNLTVAQDANSQTNAINALVEARAAKNTKSQLANSLSQFPEKVANPSELSDKKLTLAIKKRHGLLTNLTTDTPASDTLYLNSMNDPFASTYNVAKPKVTYDNYFNFDSLFTPSAYDTKQLKAAKAYLEYATKKYENLTTGVDFAKLKSKLNNLSPRERAETLENFVNNPIYQKYQLAIRSVLAAKSIGLSNLNALMAERTPVKGLATKAGIPNNPNLPAGYASPLQVQNYIANERVNNKKWYKKVKTASPATINREQLLILAEIESSLQRNHLTQERILATLSVIALQNNQSAKTAIGDAAEKMNNVIKQIDQNTSATKLNGSS